MHAQNIPDVTLLEEIGRGQGGVVFRALHRGHSCTVKLPSDKPPGAHGARSFEQDVLSLARLRRAGLPRVLQVDSSNNVPYAIMDIGQGHTLPDVLDQLTAEPRLLQLALALTSCVHELHEAGFVHGGLTADHVLVSSEGALVSCLDNGTVSRPVPFDAREDLIALGRVLGLIGERLGRGGRARSALLAIADELVEAQRSELRAVVHELDQLVTAHALPRSYPPPTTEELRSRHPQMLPRKARSELEKLRSLWDQGTQRSGKVVQLLGPTGSGKSRLLTRFLHELVDAEVQVLAVACSASDWAPFSALKRMLEGHLDGLRQVSEQRRAEIEGSLRTAAGALASHLRLLSPRLADLLRDAPTTLQEGVAQQVFIAGIADFLAKYLESGGRSVLFFDDFHSADASSRRVLTLLAPRICAQGHMIVCSARDDLESLATLERFGSRLAPDLIEVIEVQPLSAQDAGDLIAEYLGLDEAPCGELVTQLTRLCDGTPLSLRTLLDLTLEQGLLRPHNSRWRLDAEAVHRMRLPRASRTLIGRRFAMLSEADIDVFRTAAALRNHIDPRLIAQVTGIAPEQVRAALRRGVSVRLLEADASGTYKFVHDCVWEIALSQVPPSQLRALHERIADTLHASAGEGADFDYELARHHAEGELGHHPERAFLALRRAAERAIRACDDALALSFLKPAERAAALGSIEPERDFYVDLAESSLRSGSIPASLSYFGRALERCTRSHERAQVLGRIAWVHHFEGNPHESWKALEAALLECDLPVPTDNATTVLTALAGFVLGRGLGRIGRGGQTDALSQPDAQTVCELYISCARVSTENSRPVRALCSVLTLTAAMRTLQPCRTLVRAELLCAFMLSIVRADTLWRRRYARAFDMARELDDPIAQTLCHQFHHVIAGWRGDLHECEQQARLCVHERGHWMELGELCHLCFSMYAIEVARGRPLVALGWVERAIDRVQQYGRAPAVFGLIEEAAIVTLESLGRKREASQLRRRLQRVERAEVSRQGYFHWLSFQGRIQRAMEDSTLQDSLETTLGEWVRLQQEPGSAHLLVSVCYVQVAHARVHQCLRASTLERAMLLPKLAQALRDLRKLRRVPLLSAHVLFTSAAYWHFCGDQAKSEQLLAEAERAGQVHGCVWVTFAAARLRAHQLRARGLPQAARDEAASAELIARQYCQAFHIRCIRDEFELPAPVREHSRSEVDGQQVRRHLEALLQITGANSRELSPERQARYILDELLSFLAAERAFLFMRSEHDGSLAPRAARRLGGEDIDASSGYDVAIVRQVYATGQPVMSESNDLNLPERMCIAVALVLRDQVVGVLYLDRAEAADSFSMEDAALLQALANQVPVAVELANSLRERDHLQQNLRQAQKMEAIGRLAGGIAHDFNNVLTAIGFAAAGLATDRACPRDEVNEIQAAARRGAELTHQLLMFSRGNAIAPRNIELREIVQGLSGTLQRLVGNGARLHIETCKEPLPMLADPSQIERALMNLCKNANEALPNGGDICLRVTTHNAEAGSPSTTLDPERQYALLEVSDNGTGMPEDVRARLFEPFFTTKASKGTGLGLANVYAIVQQCGGHIDVVSEVGRGSLFRLYLPLNAGPFAPPARPTMLPPAPAPAPVAEPVAEPAPSRQLSVLVVDDDESVRRQTVRWLERAGHRVYAALDGEDALRTLGEHAHTLDVVLTDVHMPNMDGVALARVLHACNPSLRVLFMSGNSAVELRQQGHVVDEAVLLSKPLDAQTLLARIRRASEADRN